MKKKILIIRYQPLTYFINCISAFAAIRQKYPDDEITILTEASLADFCINSKLFDNVWIDKRPQWFQVAALRELIRKMKAAKFDLVYDLQNEKRTQWYFRLMGFYKPQWNSSVINWCSNPYFIPEGEMMHFQDLIHNQLRVTGIKATPFFDISYMANDEGANLPEKFVMICAGGDRAKLANKWNPLKYADVIDYLHQKYGLTCVLVGKGDDDNMVNAVITKQCINAKPVNYTDMTSINGLISVATKAVFCLGNETAPTHIAAYAGCKTIMLCSRFSPSELLAPRVKNMAIIEEPLLENVDPDRVADTIEEFALAKPKENDKKAFKIAAEVELQGSLSHYNKKRI